MLYVLGYTVSTLTGFSSGRYKNFESKLQNLVIHARREPNFVTYFQNSYVSLIMTH
jgi:tRNA A37 threonylcarbamoyladenosine modification protein TsaB